MRYDFRWQCEFRGIFVDLNERMFDDLAGNMNFFGLSIFKVIYDFPFFQLLYIDKISTNFWIFAIFSNS